MLNRPPVGLKQIGTPSGWFLYLFHPDSSDLRDVHHSEGITTQMKFKSDVERLVTSWENLGNPFQEESSLLINIYDRKVQEDSVSACIFSIEELGKKQYENFVSEVLISKKKSIWDPISSNKLFLMGSNASSLSSKTVS